MPRTLAPRPSKLRPVCVCGKASRVYDSVTTGLQSLYRSKLLPIEKDHLFHQFYSPELTAPCCLKATLSDAPPNRTPTSLPPR